MVHTRATENVMPDIPSPRDPLAMGKVVVKTHVEIHCPLLHRVHLPASSSCWQPKMSS
jgi:hypothetical protein